MDRLRLLDVFVLFDELSFSTVASLAEFISFKVGQLEPSSCGEICISPNEPITRPEPLKPIIAVDIETECKYALPKI